METKEQMEERRMRESMGGSGTTYHRSIPIGNGYERIVEIPSSTDWATLVDDIKDNCKPQHKHWNKIMMLYRLIPNKFESAKKMVGRIIDRIQRYGIDYKLKERDYVLMNKYYKLYK